MGPWRLSERSLRRKSDIDRVFARGRRRRSSLLTVIAVPREPETAPARVALIVSRKVSRLAVQRNRLRRQLREAFRAVSGDLTRASDVVIIAQRAALTASFADLKVVLADLLGRP